MKNDFNADHKSRHTAQQVHLISSTSHAREMIEFSRIMVWKKKKKRIVARNSSALIGHNNSNVGDERNSSNGNDTGNSSSSYLLVSSPTEEESGNLASSNEKRRRRSSFFNSSKGKGLKRRNLYSIFSIEMIDESSCHLKHIFHLDLGNGRASRKSAQKMSREQDYLLPLTSKVQEHFLSLREGFLSDTDSVEMGEALVLRMMHYGRNHHERGVQKFVTDYKALNQIAQKYTWLTILLGKIFEESNEYGARLTESQKNIETKLNCLEDDEAKIIGASLMLIVASSVNGGAGIRIWIDEYTTMRELCTEHQFLIPLFETVATRMSTKVDSKMI